MADFTPEELATLANWGYTESGVIDCSKGVYQPDSSDAGSFYQCSNGTPVRQPCPVGLHYNPTANPGPICDYPSALPQLIQKWFDKQG